MWCWKEKWLSTSQAVKYSTLLLQNHGTHSSNEVTWWSADSGMESLWSSGTPIISQTNIQVIFAITFSNAILKGMLSKIIIQTFPNFELFLTLATHSKLSLSVPMTQTLQRISAAFFALKIASFRGAWVA